MGLSVFHLVVETHTQYMDIWLLVTCLCTWTWFSPCACDYVSHPLLMKPASIFSMQFHHSFTHIFISLSSNEAFTSDKISPKHKKKT
ncbi:uncharacterized protein N7479_002526 [Penicillium vulpinum]|uniref:uncharacterized protein n=1 Tax=Penicillium vulpinum TaxID=29845 RepID=UPI0025489292|nr:uncharacterized protein N7479_002526 [Penicillium vulpinum]KAJ5972608.1 hypothetical protein N7479_002526 [Penicillium vulpinum]